MTVSAKTTEKLLWAGGEWEAGEWGTPGDKGRLPGAVTHSVRLGEGVLVQALGGWSLVMGQLLGVQVGSSLAL